MAQLEISCQEMENLKLSDEALAEVSGGSGMVRYNGNTFSCEKASNTKELIEYFYSYIKGNDNMCPHFVVRPGKEEFNDRGCLICKHLYLEW